MVGDMRQRKPTRPTVAASPFFRGSIGVSKTTSLRSKSVRTTVGHPAAPVGGQTVRNTIGGRESKSLPFPKHRFFPDTHRYVGSRKEWMVCELALLSLRWSVVGRWSSLLVKQNIFEIFERVQVT